MTLLLRLYGLGSTLAAPIARRLINKKLDLHGIAPERFGERAGRATAARPEGRLIWFHAASVGESLSVLRLMERLGTQHTDLSFLITSGTATSAKIIAQRLPSRATHQFAPLDSARYMARFLDHWRPDAAIFVESELWPHMIRQTARRGIPLSLINARISDSSARNWKRVAGTAYALLKPFAMIHCQDTRTAAHFHDLGLPHAAAGTNLKSLSGPLPYDAAELERMRSALAGRPLWLAASTHEGEDAVMLEAHAALLTRFPDLLLVLVPRHPERADAIEVQIAEAGLQGARRATGTPLGPQTQVYLADTLGEMGLWYALAPATCLCGSFTPVGGHNPYEPTYAGSAVLHGPLYANFAQTYADMHAAHAATEVESAPALITAIERLLDSPEALQKAGQAARAFATAQEDGLDDIARALSKAVSLG